MLASLEEKIKQKKLTKTEKKIVDFFLASSPRIPFMTSGEIAKKLDMSDTSVIRFVKSLGYENFSHFKTSIQKEVSNKVLTPNQKLTRNKNILDSGKVLESFVDNISKQIDVICSETSLEKIHDISEALRTSRKKYIVGFKSISGVISFFGLRLGFIMEDVYTHPENSSELLKNIIDIKENDCLVLVAYPKYSKTYNLIVDIAKKAGAKVIIITDKATSPVAYEGDLTLFVNNEGISYFNSIIPTQIIFEYILTDLSSKIEEKEMERLKLINNLLDKNVK